MTSIWGSVHSSLVPTKAFINKKPCVTNHSDFIYPCQLIAKFTVSKPPIINWKQRSSAIGFKTPRMSFKKCTIFTCNCMLHKYLLADSSANDMARSRDTLVLHLVRFSIICHVARYSTYVPRVSREVHFVQHVFTLGNQRTKKAFSNWLRCLFLFMKAFVGTRDEWMLPLWL